ncbi:manganese efflux pump MntP family protein [Paraglaciecola sp. 2405UD69-4]|uniref:manganese efflux pump MntP n=1 Tax=Paraglaciecola sp. 2405UD69-4 TaxID=3391836 RepID=UPI0039C94C5B
MFEVVILAIALSMDAFAVALSIGANHGVKEHTVGFKVALYFGICQGAMPLIGFWLGDHTFNWVSEWENWIAFVLLVGIGGKMIYETFCDGPNESVSIVTHKLLFLLAIAVSIDALAAGFTLTVLNVNPYLACFIIAITTFIFSLLGVWIGIKSGTFLQRKASLFGGIILVLIGFKVLVV